MNRKSVNPNKNIENKQRNKFLCTIPTDFERFLFHILLYSELFNWFTYVDLYCWERLPCCATGFFYLVFMYHHFTGAGRDGKSSLLSKSSRHCIAGSEIRSQTEILLL